MGKAARSPARLPVLAAALTVSLLAGDAFSQDAKELARARERFKEAAALQAAGDFGRALEAYKEVAQVKSTAAVRFNIATCEEKLGDYVRAMGSYRLALTEATRSNAKDIEASVQKALTDLEPRIPMLLVQRGDGAAVADVTLDGRALGNPSIGVEFQVNPGPHAIKATAPDRLPLTLEFNLSDREHKAVKLVLKPRPVAAPPVEPVVGPVAPPPDQPKGNKSMRIAGFVVGGLGVVGLGVSAGFFAMRQKAISDLDAECGANHMTCPASAQSTRDSGARAATIATASFIGGLGLVGVGGILIGVSTRVKAAPKPTAGLVLTPGGAGLRGTF